MPRPAPTSAPPATAPRFRNVRRSTLICCSGSMPSMRALVLGPLLALVPGFAALTATAAAHSAPTCVPTSIDNSALQGSGVTISPLPGSRDASPGTQVSFLGVPVRDLTVQSVVGSRSGAHAGRLAPYSQGDGASFVPARPFAEGERVTVRAKARVAGAWQKISDVFGIARARCDQLHARGDPSRHRRRGTAFPLAPGPAAADRHGHGQLAGRGPGLDLRGPLHGPRAGRADDPRTIGRADLVQGAAEVHLRDQPARAGIRGASRC